MTMTRRGLLGALLLALCALSAGASDYLIGTGAGGGRCAPNPCPPASRVPDPACSAPSRRHRGHHRPRGRCQLDGARCGGWITCAVLPGAMAAVGRAHPMGVVYQRVLVQAPRPPSPRLFRGFSCRSPLATPSPMQGYANTEQPRRPPTPLAPAPPRPTPLTPAHFTHTLTRPQFTHAPLSCAGLRQRGADCGRAAHPAVCPGIPGGGLRQRHVS